MKENTKQSKEYEILYTNLKRQKKKNIYWYYLWDNHHYNINLIISSSNVYTLGMVLPNWYKMDRIFLSGN